MQSNNDGDGADVLSFFACSPGRRMPLSTYAGVLFDQLRCSCSITAWLNWPFPFIRSGSCLYQSMNARCGIR